MNISKTETFRMCEPRPENYMWSQGKNQRTGNAFKYLRWKWWQLPRNAELREQEADWREPLESLLSSIERIFLSYSLHFNIFIMKFQFFDNFVFHTKHSDVDRKLFFISPRPSGIVSFPLASSCHWLPNNHPKENMLCIIVWPMV